MAVDELRFLRAGASGPGAGVSEKKPCLVCAELTSGGALTPDVCGPCWNNAIGHSRALVRLNEGRASMLSFIATIARMTTDSETPGGMSGDDACETLGALILEARELAGKAGAK